MKMNSKMIKNLHMDDEDGKSNYSHNDTEVKDALVFTFDSAEQSAPGTKYYIAEGEFKYNLEKFGYGEGYIEYEVTKTGENTYNVEVYYEYDEDHDSTTQESGQEDLELGGFHWGPEDTVNYTVTLDPLTGQFTLDTDQFQYLGGDEFVAFGFKYYTVDENGDVSKNHLEKIIIFGSDDDTTNDADSTSVV